MIGYPVWHEITDTEVRCDHQFEYKFTLKIILQLYSIETPLVKWIGGKFDLQDIDLVTYF